MRNKKATKNMEKVISRYVTTPPEFMYDLGIGQRPKFEAKTLKEIWPDMLVIGCEPHPDIYKNRVKDYPGKLLNCAVWSQTGEVDLYLCRRNPEASGLYDRSMGYKGKIKVDCLTLTDLDYIAGSPNNILLWMDVEGVELDILRNSRDLLSSDRIKYINLEVRTRRLHKLDPKPKEILKELDDLGFAFKKRYADTGTHHDRIYVRREDR